MEATMKGSFSHTYILEMERTFDTSGKLQMLRKSWHYSFLWAALYLVFVFAIQRFMRKKEPYQLTNLLIVWNVAQAIFNIIGTSRIVPEMLYVARHIGFLSTVCEFNLLNESRLTGFWFYLFGWSKIWDFCDTLFIVLRKRKLRKLHLIHHSLAIIITWYFGAETLAVGSWFITMNYFIHAIMYLYYAAKTMKFTVPVYIAMIITILQIMQLVFGFILAFLMTSVLSSGKTCNASYLTCFVAFVFYCFMSSLFVHYFYTKYIEKKTTKEKSVTGHKID